MSSQKIIETQLSLFEDPETTIKASRAEFSPDRIHRYALWRTWDKTLGVAMFLCLNPSTADEIQNDPTVTRCINYAKRWGYGGMIMSNIFAFRATDPADMKAAKDPIGPENDKWLIKLSKEADIIIAAWGNHGKFMNRGPAVLKLLNNLHYLEMNNTGNPKHPLYCKGDLMPIPMIDSSITIMNLKETKPSEKWDVKADRSSPLGNKVPMKKESNRDSVCDQYDIWFNEMVFEKQDPTVLKELNRLVALYKKYGKLRFFCWCAPKRCHVETIVLYIKGRVLRENLNNKNCVE